MTGRIIGIRHRVKQTAESEARPTQVVIIDEGQVKRFELPTEQDEFDFLRGQFPISFRNVIAADDVSGRPLSHLKTRNIRVGEEPNSNHVVQYGRDRHIVLKIADKFDGLQSDDRIAMILGGSGDYFALALARRGEEIGASVARIPAYRLKEVRGESNKDDDALLLAELLRDKPDIFYDLRARDREIIALREAYRARIDAMKARIACEQRLRQRFIGGIFCKPDGYFPEGQIEKLYDEAKANDPIYQALLKEETARERELQRLVESSGVWRHVFGEVEGMGWAIASRIIASVVDIRRFPGKPQFKAFSGVHVLPEGKFARRRSGSIANWSPDARQAFFLFGDQMNRRPDSVWGRKLREYKVKFRAKYPEPIVGEKGVKKYTNLHIHRMATWRTITKFAEWLYREWTRHEKSDESAVIARTRKAA